MRLGNRISYWMGMQSGKFGGPGILAVSGNEQGMAGERYEVYRKHIIQ